MERSAKAPVRKKRKPPASASSSSSSKRRRQQPAAAPPDAPLAPRARPKLATRRPSSVSRAVELKLKEKKTKVKSVEQLALFSRHADPSVQSPGPRRMETLSEVSRVTAYNPTGATLLETPPSRHSRLKTVATPPSNGEAVDLATVKDVASLEVVEGDGILETLIRSTTPRVKRRFPSEDALTDSEQRDREALRRRRLKLRSQYSSMKEGETQRRSPQIERNLFQAVGREEELAKVLDGEHEKKDERAQLEEEEAETDEETTESKINRLSKAMHTNWRQVVLWLASGAFLLCAMVVAAPFVKKLLEPPLPYCDSEWVEAKEGSFVLADPADHFDRSKALEPFIGTAAVAARTSVPVCQPCPVYGNCLNGSVISCAPPYVLQYGLCKENPAVQENLDQLALSIQKFVVEKAAKNACDNVSLWSYLYSDGEAEPTSDLTASIEVLLSDVQIFVTRTISFGKAVSALPREYVFNRALDMALRDLKDIFVTEDQSQLVVGGGVVPWSCRAKHQLYSHIKLIALAVALGTALVFGYRQFLLYRTERQLVDRFVKEVRFYLLDRTRRPDRFYPADHLRDDLFEKQSLQDRAWLSKSVWPKVAAVVKDDSRISTRLMRVRGEDLVVWEWASSSSPAHRRPGGNRGRGFRAPSRPQQAATNYARPLQVRQRKKPSRVSSSW
ncbi:hypothetical protein PHYPSEUDO_013273 [Phytophthora pseudosyringae]|uniref:Man1/Src1-like C-terminal domain-containing protein n=1 Tax=Phytophthora pseudosyringae TaxID=221518 RepID=A0A8T1W3X9_9STRA|nr:hypothetical protein PHYPSEUDO_013273 [Phytophthora pseudosyringae]